MIIAARIAVPNPSITKVEPIKLWVIINVIALITNKKKPKLITVIGRVNTIKIGFTIVFSIARTRLAINAAPKLSKWNDSNI